MFCTSPESCVRQSSCLFVWNEKYSFDVPALVWDNTMLFVAIKPSGPCFGGPQPTSNAEYWKVLSGSAPEEGALSFAVPSPGQFFSFYEPNPPKGWMVRNGGVLTNASTRFPQLWSHLLESEQAWKLKTEEEWLAMSGAEPWNGIGGVPYFVLNREGNSVRLPDTRGMYLEDAGFDGLEVGGVHGDAVRDVSGGLILYNYAGLGLLRKASGAFSAVRSLSKVLCGAEKTDSVFGGVDFALSRQVPTAGQNQPRAFGVLGCVYVGGV